MLMLILFKKKNPFLETASHMQILVGNAAVSTSETFIYNHLKIRQSRYRRQKSRYCLKFFSELHPKNGFNQIYQTISDIGLYRSR